ncbi:cytochrome P450 4C1 [Nasonia vitripennis]|uniref:Cytochrome P450 n=1 Tax=Nasonia vitripennis TaxID=7425 RepID=A0A7M7G935_NASVI|nr:cytochrome P450 4C1 [Nasonia vitripennis]
MVPLLLLFTLLAIVGFVISRWIYEYVGLRQKLSTIPGPTLLPFVGIVLERMRIPKEDVWQWFNDLCFKFESGMVLAWVGTQPIVILRRPQQMEVILPSNTLITKAATYDYMKPWLGDGLVTSTGELWFSHRRLITPAFHFGVLEEYGAVMREKVEIFKECIESELKTDPKAPINIFGLVVKYTLDTICETAMGVNIDTQRNPESAYVKAVHTYARLTVERFYKPWLKWNAIYYRTNKGKEALNAVKIMHSFTEKVIRQKQAERKEKSFSNKELSDEVDEFGKRKRKAFLDLLLSASENASNPLTFEELREEVDTFMFAGHDTTSSAISWGLFALANAPEIQAKVHKELQEIFGDSGETANSKQLSELKYLDRVIKEVLRLYPSAPMVSRRLTHDTVIDNHHVPKGTFVNIHIYQMHHDPKVWKDPETFDPDRFLPENIRSRHPYSYVPFSAGPRNCIGQKFALLEVKTALTAILRKWQISSVLKPTEIKMIHTFILRPQNESLELYFTPIVK